MNIGNEPGVMPLAGTVGAPGSASKTNSANSGLIKYDSDLKDEGTLASISDRSVGPMKRRESKIPLLLTMMVLGYFIFWAVGYVNRNRPREAPLTEMQRPAVVTEVREQQPPQVQPVVSPSNNPVANVQVSKAPVREGPPPANVNDNSEDVVLSGRTQNRKLAGLLEDSTKKH